MSTTVFEKVAWSEGVLILPQHFQQLDRYHESLLAARLSAVQPLSWGALNIELDAAALRHGMVALTNFEGVLPDGTPIAASARTAQLPKQRPIEGHLDVAQRSVVIYVAVPNERPRVNNHGDDGSTRYRTVAQQVFDTSRDGRGAAVQCALPNVSLLFGDESRDGFTALPIASLVRDERGELALSPTFVPPVLKIAASGVIMHRLDRLLRLMIARHRTLTQKRRITGEGRVEFTSADVTIYLQLSALNSMLPKVHHLARAPHVSPTDAFLTLAELAGQLATFSPQSDMTVPLDFDFADLETSFRTVFDLNERLLEVTDTERFVSCALEAAGGGRHYAELHDARLERGVRFLIGVEVALPRPQVVEEFVKRAKLASHGDMEFVLAKQVGGINVTECVRPAPELPVRPGLVYFDLPADEHDVYWKHVQKDRNLVVWLPPALEQSHATVKLFGVFASR